MDLCFVKQGNALYPVRDEDQEWMSKAGNGEHYLTRIRKIRNPKFHRKYFAMLNFAFEYWNPPTHWQDLSPQQKKLAQEYGMPDKNFDEFRKNIIILAGYYETVIDISGRIKLTAKSIAFDKMEDWEFSKLYEATWNAIAKHIFSHYTDEQLKGVEKVLMEF